MLNFIRRLTLTVLIEFKTLDLIKMIISKELIIYLI
jgi:hypothetical protein